MINATHYVLDLETMGKGPNAAIATIGCVKVEHGTIADEFYARVSLASAMQYGLAMDASTVQWWLRQSEEARNEITGVDGEILPTALINLALFMGDIDEPNKTALVWGNGPSFDNAILANAYTAIRRHPPWAYWNDRDMRTLLALYPEAKQIEFEGIKHHALHDARHEARQLVAGLQLMKQQKI